MRSRKLPIPVPDKGARLKPGDFAIILRHVPHDCVLIGGQAVAWWAERYGVKAIVRGREQEVTSRDIDFWGTRENLLYIASVLKRSPAFPGRHEMTLLIGAIELQIAGRKTTLEVLHAVPGLDSANPMSVAVEEEIESGCKQSLLVMSPVSLVLAKLHALRHFKQDDRQDLVHLEVSLLSSKAFIAELVNYNTRLALWNCNRLIDAQRQKPNQKMEQRYGFQILSAVPIDGFRTAGRGLKAIDRQRLEKFLSVQWPRVTSME